MEFRKKYQTPETRREFDLNDPLGCRKGQPNRIDDNDPRITLSSGQRWVLLLKLPKPNKKITNYLLPAIIHYALYLN